MLYSVYHNTRDNNLMSPILSSKIFPYILLQFTLALRNFSIPIKKDKILNDYKPINIMQINTNCDII